MIQKYKYACKQQAASVSPYHAVVKRFTLRVELNVMGSLHLHVGK
jgi:hypothetical protein